MIACYVAVWHEFVPDCPADLEVTTSDILGVYSTAEAAQAAIERFKARRKEIDNEPDWQEEELDGFGSWHYFELDEECEFYPTGSYPIHHFGEKDVTYHYDDPPGGD